MAIELGAVAFEIKPVDSTELVTIAERIRLRLLDEIIPDI